MTAKLTPLNTELLLSLGSSIKTGWELCDSKWKKGETELIALQTLSAAANNLKDHGEALSWAGKNVFSGRQICGTDNAFGVDQLINDGSIIVEPYIGNLAPKKPENIATDENGNFLVFRPTNSLIYYAASMILKD